MARIRLFIYIILFTILPAAAGVFDATSAARLLFNAESRAASDPDVYAGVLVRLDDEERGLATLAEAQARIFGRRGDIDADTDGPQAAANIFKQYAGKFFSA